MASVTEARASQEAGVSEAAEEAEPSEVGLRNSATSRSNKPPPGLPPAGGALRHIVCFKFRDDATQEAKDALVAGFAHLPSEIDTIRSFE